MEVVGAIAINLAAVFVLFVLRLLGFDLFARVIRVQRRVGLWIRRRFRGRETILVYTDYDEDGYATRALVSSLNRQFKDAALLLQARAIVDANQLLRWPFPVKNMRGVVLLLTDVTQLATSAKDRTLLQSRLRTFVNKGGVLILGHDVIWRRSRNEILQRLTGGVQVNFHQTSQPIEYVPPVADRATSNAALAAALKPTISLSDAEVLEGRWENDVEFLYSWATNLSTPLATRREVQNGTVFWVNSGDRGRNHSPGADDAPRSIGKPELEFVELVVAMLRYK